MLKGKIKVEQVDKNGNIVEDYDTRLTQNELFNVFEQKFPAISEGKAGVVLGEYKGKSFAIRVKNITYLGKPHKKYKKRYQIPNDLHEFYDWAIKEGKEPLMIGVYTYEDNTLFVNFNISTYIDEKANNSSAHVYTMDLVNALISDEGAESGEDEETGYYKKLDFRGNEITVFNSDKKSVEYFLDELFNTEDILKNELQSLSEMFETDEMEYVVQSERGKRTPAVKYEIEPAKRHDDTRVKRYGKKVVSKKIENIILDFFENESRTWKGIDCYDEMFKAVYRNRNQGEWPGFYLEYRFENFLSQNNLLDEICYLQEKTHEGIDLDLLFSKLDVYGDLKAHSINQTAIPGNDIDTIKQAISEKKYILYIVCEHETIKDSECKYEVTKYWNANKDNIKKNQNPMSYSKRMKNQVDLKTVCILSIDKDNYKYLKGFKQGKNSNSKPRKVKIMVDVKDIGKFLKIKYQL